MQSGTNYFDVFKAAREQYHVEMGHTSEYEKIWEIVRKDSKWIKAQTLSETQSKRSYNFSTFDVSNARTNIDLNANTNDILGDFKEILPSRQPVQLNPKRQKKIKSKGLFKLKKKLKEQKYTVLQTT